MAVEIWGTHGGPGSRHGLDKIKYMYSPFIETIRAGAAHLLGPSHVRVRYVGLLDDLNLCKLG